MREDLINFKKYYLEVVPKVPADSFFRQSMNHKYRHSIDVLHCGQEIMQKTPELANISVQFTNFAEQALLFHDVGRFEEAFLRYEAGKNSDLTADVLAQFDHGIIGYNLLKENQKYNDLRILFAVRYHGKMMEDVRMSEMWQNVVKSADRDEILQIFYLVRDADKVANLQTARKTDHLKQDIFYKCLSNDAKIAPLTSKVKEQFFTGKTVLSATVQTFADRLLQVLSWIYDFNYEYTKAVFINQGYAQFLFDELVKYHPDKTELQKIKEIIKL